MASLNGSVSDIFAIGRDRYHFTPISISAGPTCNFELGIACQLNHKSFCFKTDLALGLTFRAAAGTDTACFRGINICQTKLHAIYPPAIAIGPVN
jgi:hypothetical protein